MKVLIIVDNHVDTDPRVINQWEALKMHAQIYFMANSVKTIPCKHFFKLSKITRKYQFHYNYPYFVRKVVTLFLLTYKALLKFIARFKYENPYERRYWKHVKKDFLNHIKKNYSFDVIIANDINTLPIAAFLKKDNTKLIFDAHEYFLDEDETVEFKKHEVPYLRYLIDTYIRYVDVFITVGDKIASCFQEVLNLNYKPAVVFNAKPYHDYKPSPVSPQKIRMVHHGVAIPNRKLDYLIEVLKHLPDTFELHLYLNIIDHKYYKYFYKKYNKTNRLYIHDAVPFEKIIPTIHQYDIGIFLSNNKSSNSEYCLPNKFFEFIQARLMLVMSPFYEVKNLIDRYKNGIIVFGSPEDIANTIKSLTPEQIETYKWNSNIAAKELSVEKEWEKIRKLVGIQP
ncbi:MAG: hypothetical protein NZ519_04385 [Bacteroidia bacterium]|nr:hypothetical protein [Bacteroidia bacterium]MDW8347683.1 hypothetical protein [Bacteroidia bacterium]